MVRCPCCGGQAKELVDCFLCTSGELRDRDGVRRCGHVWFKAKYHGLSDAEKALALQADGLRDLAQLAARRKAW